MVSSTFHNWMKEVFFVVFKNKKCRKKVLFWSSGQKWSESFHRARARVHNNVVGSDFVKMKFSLKNGRCVHQVVFYTKCIAAESKYGPEHLQWFQLCTWTNDLYLIAQTTILAIKFRLEWRRDRNEQNKKKHNRISMQNIGPSLLCHSFFSAWNSLQQPTTAQTPLKQKTTSAYSTRLSNE